MRSLLVLCPALAASCALDLGRDHGGETLSSCEVSIWMVDEAPIPLDILLVIDDARTMAPSRANLIENIPRLARALESFDWPGLSVHLAVVSADGGGRLHAPDRCGIEGAFLVDEPLPSWACGLPDGAACRARNYPGTLAEALACLADLPPREHEIAQPLEAMRRALDGGHPDNAGFRRNHAYLGVHFLTASDDCSGAAPGDFDSLFECLQDGLVCDGGPLLPEPALYRSCAPRAVAVVRHPDDYADFLAGLVADEWMAVVSAASGGVAPVEVELDEEGAPRLAPSCSSPAGEAIPAVRLGAFLDRFPGRSAGIRLCHEDLSDLFSLYRGHGHPGGPACASGADPTDLDPEEPGLQLDCVVAFQPASDPGSEIPVPRCRMAAADVPAPDRLPCWWAEPDLWCDAAALRIASFGARAGTYRARCAALCE
jgi:hypothetical protein